jgi:hypothetical protein
MHDGLLWMSYGWLVMTPNGMTVQRAGRHIIIFCDIDGDRTPGGTQIKYVDPSDGAFHTTSIDRMFQQHETGPLCSRSLTSIRPVLQGHSQFSPLPLHGSVSAGCKLPKSAV